MKQGRVKYLARLTHLRLEDKNIETIVRRNHAVRGVPLTSMLSLTVCCEPLQHTGELAVLPEVVHCVPSEQLYQTSLRAYDNSTDHPRVLRGAFCFCKAPTAFHSVQRAVLY